MKYVKTFEQVQDIYPSTETKYLVVTEDEKWYLPGHDAHSHDETDDGYVMLREVDTLKEIKTSYFLNKHDIDGYSLSRQVVDRKLASKFGLTREKIDISTTLSDRDNMLDEIMWKYDDGSVPKYTDDELREMSDDEIKKIFMDEVVGDDDNYSRGDGEESGKFVYIEKLPLKLIPFQFGAIRKNSLNI